MTYAKHTSSVSDRVRPPRAHVKIYHGFGHTHDMTIFGHVFNHSTKYTASHVRNPLRNMWRMLRLFFVRPLPGVKVMLQWNSKLISSLTETDGFFRIDWKSDRDVDAGWHQVMVKTGDDNKGVVGQGLVFVPHKTQFGFISDIDDTIMVSHSGTVWQRLKTLLFNNPHMRKIFPDVALHYSLLSAAHTTPEAPNPFFYVSSSEWNLYDYLVDVFRFRKLPEGAFLLNQIKRWYEMLKTGKTKHQGKLLRIARIFEAFPNQRFVLLGDNSQSDPDIYFKLAEKYGSRVHAVYIRVVNSRRLPVTTQTLASLEAKGIKVCLFTHSAEAIAHSRAIGLIV